jgi:hypothetical protein
MTASRGASQRGSSPLSLAGNVAQLGRVVRLLSKGGAGDRAAEKCRNFVRCTLRDAQSLAMEGDLAPVLRALEDFYESLLTGQCGPTYIPTTDGDAALCGHRVLASSRATRVYST